MGSLLPGWEDALPGTTPKEFQDFNEDEEELGYFAAYNKMKKQQREAGELSRTSAPPGLSRRLSLPISLARTSVPGSRGEPNTPTSARSMSYKESPTFGSFKARPQLQRLQSMPVSTGDRYDILSPKTPLSPSAGSPHSPSLAAYKTHKEEHREVQWWRNFDSAHLNEMPDVPETKDRGFIPQYSVAGQKLHYRGVEQDSTPAELAAASALL